MSDDDNEGRGGRTGGGRIRAPLIKAHSSLPPGGDSDDDTSGDEERAVDRKKRDQRSEDDDDNGGGGDLRRQRKGAGSGAAGGSGDVELPLLRDGKGRKGRDERPPPKGRQPQGRRDGGRGSRDIVQPNPTGPLATDMRSQVMALLMRHKQGKLYSKERIVQVCTVFLLIGCILSFQTCCVFDRVCYNRIGDPAVPRHAADAVIPVALVVGLFVAPLSLYAVNPHATRRMIIFAGLVAAGAAVFFLVTFSKLFDSSRLIPLTELVTEQWSSYPTQVRDYYGSVEAVVHKRRAFTQHVAIYGLIAFICTAISSSAILTMICLPILSNWSFINNWQWSR